MVRHPGDRAAARAGVAAPGAHRRRARPQWQHGRVDAVTNVPLPVNEPVRSYAPGSPERSSLEARLDELGSTRHELTMTIAGQQRPGSGEPIDVVQPHRHAAVLGTTHAAGAEDVQAAVDAALAAAPAWRDASYDDRAAVLLRAADLLAGPVARHPERRDDARAEQDRASRPRSTAPASSSTSCASTSPSAGRSSSSSRSRAPGCGTAPTTGRSRASSSRSRRSTSPRSPATCRSRPRSWATRSSGSPRRRSSCRPTSPCGCSRRRGCRRGSSTW